MRHRIDGLRAPLLVSWQMTRDCDLCCLHCCTESAPGKRLSDELDASEAMQLADEIIRNDVPYVMLCGGEPLIVPHFIEVAEALGNAGVHLKIETNGQRLDAAILNRLAKLPIRSIQISLDADTQQIYEQQRPGASLRKAHAACRAVRDAGLPLEITFAPTRVNIHEAEQVIARALQFGAFRFNTGKLMRIGTAARLWKRLEPTELAYRDFRHSLDQWSQRIGQQMELCYIPFEVKDALLASIGEPPATMLVLPNGWVKVAAALPLICADLRRETLADAWSSYCRAWRSSNVAQSARLAASDEARHAEANSWTRISVAVA